MKNEIDTLLMLKYGSSTHSFEYLNNLPPEIIHKAYMSIYGTESGFPNADPLFKKRMVYTALLHAIEKSLLLKLIKDSLIEYHANDI